MWAKAHGVARAAAPSRADQPHPPFLQVYVSGRVEQAGTVTLPQGQPGAGGGSRRWHQGAARQGGIHPLHPRREIDRRIFGFKSDAPSGDYRNPVLMAGDVIRLRETALTKSLAVINEFSTPAVGVYSMYSLFDGFSN